MCRLGTLAVTLICLAFDELQASRQAPDSEMTEDDVIVRYEGEEVVGLTVLHASKR